MDRVAVAVGTAGDAGAAGDVDVAAVGVSSGLRFRPNVPST